MVAAAAVAGGTAAVAAVVAEATTEEEAAAVGVVIPIEAAVGVVMPIEAAVEVVMAIEAATEAAPEIAVAAVMAAKTSEAASEATLVRPEVPIISVPADEVVETSAVVEISADLVVATGEANPLLRSGGPFPPIPSWKCLLTLATALITLPRPM